MANPRSPEEEDPGLNSLLLLVIVPFGVEPFKKVVARHRKSSKGTLGGAGVVSELVPWGSLWIERKQAGEKMQASQKIARRRVTKEGKGWRVDDKETRKGRLLSQAPLFSSFIRISFSRLLPVSLECFWRRSTASAFLLAFTPCGQLRRRPVGGEKRRDKKKNHTWLLL